MRHDPRVDQQIASAPEWASAILTHLRALVHLGAADVTEDIKWGRPFFLIDGRPFAMMAAFQTHCTFAFWRMATPLKETEGGGQYGKIRAISDLPDDGALLAEIDMAAAMARSQQPIARTKVFPKAEMDMPADLSAALEEAPLSRTGFDSLPQGARREYLEWIGAAKRPETRERRIATAVAQTAEGKKLNWKYEKC